MAPAGLSIWLALWLVNFVDERIKPLLPAWANLDLYMQQWLGVPVDVPGFGLVVLLISVTMVGAITAGILGKWLRRAMDRLLARLPIVGSVYSASRQILETLVQDRNQAFRRVVLVEWPKAGIWTIAFVTGRSGGVVDEALPDQNRLAIYVPTTPNPTSGYLMYVREEDTRRLNMPVENAVRLVISMGLAANEEKS